jgi:uncharacterized protein (TIRG00374 family)
MNSRTLKVVILLILGLLLLFLWVKTVDIPALSSQLRQTQLGFIGIAVVFYLLGILVRSIRWKLLLSHITDIRTGTSFNLYLSGQLFNYLIPLRIGEVAKSVFLKQKKDVRITKSLPTIIVDKVLDLFVLLIVIFFLIALVEQAKNIPLIWIFALIIILGLAFLTYSIHRPNALLTLITSILFFIPSFKERAKTFAASILNELRLITRRKTILIAALILSAIALLFDAAFFYALLLSIRMSHVPIAYAFFGYCLIIISYMLPTPPAQIGSNEILFMVVFTILLGLDKTKIAAITLLFHVTTTLVLTLGGLLSLRLLKIDLSKVPELLSRKK